jgi:glycosyltransferase involved in cell wall biosynthesis
MLTTSGAPPFSTSPMVSIVTPSFNSMPYIRDNVESVRSQDYPDIEHIVMDGGSTDGTREYLASQGHLIWASQPDRGQSDALNKGFRLARGEIVGWLNSDDVYRPGAVSAGAQFLLDHPEVDLVYGDVRIIDENGYIVGIARSRVLDLERLLITNPVQQPSVFMRRRLIEQLGGVDERLHYALDYELWLRLAVKGFNGHYLAGTILADYRMCPGTKSYDAPASELKEWLDVVERFFVAPESAGISKKTRKRIMGNLCGQYYTAEMLKAIGQKKRMQMIGFLGSAVKWQPSLAVNRGMWFFVIRGLFGRKIDRLRKFRKSRQ